MALTERPAPQAAINDVVVQVHASGFVPTELEWPSTWADRLDRDRTPSIPRHALAGVVSALSYGTSGLSVGQRVFGLTDSTASRSTSSSSPIVGSLSGPTTSDSCCAGYEGVGVLVANHPED
jgi:NADPH:quinone reductase-like Zn-dependent oxidoreductase